MRCIDADALLTDLNNIKYPGAPYVDAGIRIAVGKICDAKTIEPERMKGKWISDRLITTNGGTYGVRRCSECEACYQGVGYGWNFCPNCGARMTEEDV